MKLSLNARKLFPRFGVGPKIEASRFSHLEEENRRLEEENRNLLARIKTLARALAEAHESLDRLTPEEEE